LASDKFAQSLIKNESYKLNMLINHASKQSQDIEMRGLNTYNDSNLKDKLIH